MSFVAVAIGGAAVVGAVGTSIAANRAGDAAERGAQNAADAQVISTQMQIEEIRRQFDYQQQILLPQIQQQYNAQGAFADLLGIAGPSLTTREQDHLQQQLDQYENALQDPNLPRGQRQVLEFQRDRAQMEYDNIATRGPTGTDSYGDPRFPQSGSGGAFGRGDRGEFVDPNLDPTRLADVNTYGDTVRENLLAGTSAEDDPYRNYIADNQIAAGTAADDARVRRAEDVRLLDQRGGENIAEGAAGISVYGDTFQASPGYEFAVEEANRATDRLRSRGGNYGGRAIVEAQRRAIGTANQEYYNWAAGRSRDVDRLAGAEAQDIMRRDRFAGVDIARGDTALSQYEGQRIADVGRGDQAYQDFIRRQEGDAARLDAAAVQEDQLLASDRARGDQSYYNYIANLGQVAGFGGGPAATAVDASAAAGTQVAGAYRSQGNNLSNIYGNLGNTQAEIEGQRIAGINNALVSGVQNFVTYKNSQPPATPPRPPRPPLPGGP